MQIRHLLFNVPMTGTCSTYNRNEEKKNEQMNEMCLYRTVRRQQGPIKFLRDVDLVVGWPGPMNFPTLCWSLNY